MSDGYVNIVATTLDGWSQGVDLVKSLFAVASPEAVFSQPVEMGEQKVITASEAWVAGGFGYGMGGSSGSAPAGRGPAAQSPGEEGEQESPGDAGDQDGGAGGGGGGGGTVTSRPVAAISVGPYGVRVEPIVDVTKLGLAFFTLLGTLLVGGQARRLLQGSRAPKMLEE